MDAPQKANGLKLECLTVGCRRSLVRSAPFRFLPPSLSGQRGPGDILRVQEFRAAADFLAKHKENT